MQVDMGDHSIVNYEEENDFPLFRWIASSLYFFKKIDLTRYIPIIQYKLIEETEMTCDVMINL